MFLKLLFMFKTKTEDTGVSSMDYMERLRDLKGVGEKTEKLYQKLDIYTVGDLLLHYPRSYQTFPPLANYGELHPNSTVAILARLKSPARIRKGHRMDVTLATAFFGDHSLELIWFRMPYVRSQLAVGEAFVFYGKLEEGNRLKMSQAQIYTPDKYRTLMQQPQPVYGLTRGLTNNNVRKMVQTVFDSGIHMGEYLPPELLESNQLVPYEWAMKQIHFPMDFDHLLRARQRLVYDEFFFFLLEMGRNRLEEVPAENHHLITKTVQMQAVQKQLPFALTGGQEEALEDILEDLRAPQVSQRLIQGDVGSGKTIVAFLSMLACLENGYQAVIMAPTEVLARQHEREFTKLCQKYALPYSVVCLTGSSTVRQRREIQSKILDEGALFIIGTHALIQDPVEFRKLALVVTDEQHRFGVRQRKMLASKGQSPNVLVMSATPIPRTLAMILYGDMNLSVIRDLPASRKKTKNAVVRAEKKRTAWQFVAKEVLAGRQAYVICPLVEASDVSEDENVIDYAQTLKDFYGDQITVGLLHGRMKSKEKDRVMEAFSSGKIQVLVSTTVVEVGVNVPNASVMIIENANRFGLAQLHQLRGRVGRGADQAYCIFIDSSDSEEIPRRLEVLVHSDDGFTIASEDLKLRGPGDFFGIRQSGELDFRIADIYQDANVLQMASEDCREILAADPKLMFEEHAGIRSFLERRSQEVYTNL